MHSLRHLESFLWKTLCNIIAHIILYILTLVLLNCLFPFFVHLKLELLTQFPASKDEKCLYL